MTKMTATDPYYTFLNKTLSQGDLQILSLAGDASARRYYRVVSGEDSYVLMCWEPFLDEAAYPFLNVREHFERALTIVGSTAVPGENGLEVIGGRDVVIEVLDDVGDVRAFGCESGKVQHNGPL